MTIPEEILTKFLLGIEQPFFSQQFVGQFGSLKLDSFYLLKGDDGMKERVNYFTQDSEVNFGFSQ